MFVSSTAFLYERDSGIKKTTHASKKRMLPINAKISLFFKLEAEKKMAQIIKVIQPTK